MPIALLVIDIQNDYFPGGRMALEGAIEAGQRAGELLDAFRRRGWPVVHIQHISTRPGASFFLPDSEGVRMHASVAPLQNEAVFRKHFPNSFRDTPLLDHLRGLSIDRLAIAGMMTHMCVDATVRAAFDHGFQCLLAHDACATRALAFEGHEVPAQQVHHAFLAALSGLYAKIAGASELVANLGQATALK